MTKRKCSIISEIEKLEASLKTWHHKVEVLEGNLKSRYMSVEEREKLEKELADVKSILSRNQAELQTLHKENSKTFAFAVLIMFFAFLGYGIYVMLTNTASR
ncbi:hypothetical protein L9F63_007300 [Diploptera punctata]|uniref:Coiled-coil domain-containing protein 167 n=1 Tax=Diploptera punctata TaxID=6984 RepID=A0AAD7Z8T8_DIPPU|nr:hypothetical protein L9F63_007300 [Diploptera punctata]